MVSVGDAIVPAWAKWAGLAGGLALLIWIACWLNVRYFINPAVNAETSRWNIRWADRDKADLQAGIDAEAARRNLERKNQDAIDQLQIDAQVEADRLRALRAAADAKSMQLQQGIETAIARLQGGRDTGTTAGGKAGNATSLLLAQLYGEIDTAAGNYAAEADRARAAGLTCEKAWEGLRAGHRAVPEPDSPK